MAARCLVSGVLTGVKAFMIRVNREGLEAAGV